MSNYRSGNHKKCNTKEKPDSGVVDVIEKIKGVFLENSQFDAHKIQTPANVTNKDNTIILSMPAVAYQQSVLSLAQQAAQGLSRKGPPLTDHQRTQPFAFAATTDKLNVTRTCPCTPC
jgi:hypothetical protein